jgi:hypothetical protein
MTNEQFNREVEYGTRKHIADRLLRQGLISEREYRQLCTKYERIYRPIIGGLRAPKNL